MSTQGRAWHAQTKRDLLLKSETRKQRRADLDEQRRRVEEHHRNTRPSR